MKKRIFPVLGLLVLTLLTGCAQSEPYTPKTYTPETETIQSLRIDVRDRTVAVSPSSDGEFRLDYAESGKESYDFSVSEEGVLTMTAVQNKEWTDYIGGKAPEAARTISVRVPDGLLEELWIATTNGEITVSGVTENKNAALSANGGDIVLDALSVGKALTLDVKNGNISGWLSGSYDDYAISCAVKKGDANLPASKEGSAKTLTVTANNGDVNLDIR